MKESLQSWLGTNLLPSLIIFVVAILINRFGTAFIASFIRRAFRPRHHGTNTEEDIKKRQNTLISMSSAILRVAVWAVAFFTILGYFGINLTPLLAGAGVLGVALAFGSQSLVRDFLSGMFIILENQYRVGDLVELDGATGTVEHVSIRTTVVRATDGSVHFIPNGNLTHTINKSVGYSKLNLAITVSPKTDVDKLIGLINQIGLKLAEDEKFKQKIIKAPHFLNISSFNNKAIEIKISGKTKPSAQWSVSGELRKRLLSEFKKHKIDLASFTAIVDQPKA